MQNVEISRLYRRLTESTLLLGTQWQTDLVLILIIYMNKYDFIPAGATIIVALAWFLFNFISSIDGTLCEVYKDNALIQTIDISKDAHIILNDNEMEIVVKNKSVDVVNSVCKDKLCVHQKPISKNGETIVCLPNRIVLEIKGNSSDLHGVEYDGYTN